jgi:hypothetical protein
MPLSRVERKTVERKTAYSPSNLQAFYSEISDFRENEAWKGKIVKSEKVEVKSQE